MLKHSDKSDKETIQALEIEIARLQKDYKKVVNQLDETLRMEELYKESQERFRSIFEYSKLGNKIISSDLKIIEVNQALIDMLGFTEDELVGSQILDYTLPEDREDWYKLQQQLWQKQMPSFMLETHLIRKDGSVFDCKVTSILYPEKGKDYGYTIIEDISKRKQTEAMLHRNENMLQFIFQHVPQKIFTAKTNGEVFFYNQQWETFTGVPLSEIRDWGWTQIIHADDVENTIKTWKERILDGQTYEIQHRFRQKNGSYCWHLTRAVPIKNQDGIITQWVGSSTNLDEQKKAEERKDEFISIASHELKTPLTNIKAYNQLLLKLMKIDDPRFRFVKKSSDQIERLQRLISDLLDVTKINAGEISYNIEEFNFKDALLEAVEGIQDTTKTHQIIVENPVDVMYRGDRTRIEQVISNLLTNAIKYSPNAEKIIVRTSLEEGGITVAIQDFGIGIEPKNLSKLFNRYYRVEKTSSQYQGMGLGLYIVSEILKRHNGMFWIESELGKGSTFFFRLPLENEVDNTLLSTNTAYLDNHIEIKYNQGQQILYADWKGFQTVESVKKGCMLMLDLLQKNHCSKVLNDNSNVRGTWSEASEWLGRQWFPLMEENGMKYFAWVYSPSRFSQLSADTTIAKKTGTVETKFFYDSNQAEAWLMEMD